MAGQRTMTDAQPPWTGTTASSTDSGQGMEPLSDTFVAVSVGRGSRRELNQHVEAPEGSVQMLIQ